MKNKILLIVSIFLIILILFSFVSAVNPTTTSRDSTSRDTGNADTRSTDRGSSDATNTGNIQTNNVDCKSSMPLQPAARTAWQNQCSKSNNKNKDNNAIDCKSSMPLQPAARTAWQNQCSKSNTGTTSSVNCNVKMYGNAAWDAACKTTPKTPAIDCNSRPLLLTADWNAACGGSLEKPINCNGPIPHAASPALQAAWQEQCGGSLEKPKIDCNARLLALYNPEWQEQCGNKNPVEKPINCNARPLYLAADKQAAWQEQCGGNTPVEKPIDCNSRPLLLTADWNAACGGSLEKPEIDCNARLLALYNPEWQEQCGNKDSVEKPIDCNSRPLLLAADKQSAWQEQCGGNTPVEKPINCNGNIPLAASARTAWQEQCGNKDPTPPKIDCNGNIPLAASARTAWQEQCGGNTNTESEDNKDDGNDNNVNNNNNNYDYGAGCPDGMAYDKVNRICVKLSVCISDTQCSNGYVCSNGRCQPTRGLDKFEENELKPTPKAAGEGPEDITSRYTSIKCNKDSDCPAPLNAYPYDSDIKIYGSSKVYFRCENRHCSPHSINLKPPRD